MGIVRIKINRINKILLIFIYFVLLSTADGVTFENTDIQIEHKIRNKIKYPIMKQVFLYSDKTDFPIIPGTPVNEGKYIYIPDNASGFIYKYNVETLEVIEKFSAFPDALKPLSISKKDAALYSFYFGCVSAFNISIFFSETNNLLIFDAYNSNKVRELDSAGNLLNVIKLPGKITRKKITQTPALKKFYSQFRYRLMQIPDRFFFTGDHLALCNISENKVISYSTNDNFNKMSEYSIEDFIALNKAKKINSDLLKKYFTSTSKKLFPGCDNELYAVDNTGAHPANDQLKRPLNDFNYETNSFIGVDKDKNEYYWSTLETDLYISNSITKIMPIVKVFDTKGKIIRILKNELWNEQPERYGMSEKTIDPAGNIYFTFYDSVEKFRFDGEFDNYIITGEESIFPAKIFVSEEYIFIYDRLSSSITIIKNVSDPDWFRVPLTDDNFFVTSFDISGGKIFYSGYSMNNDAKKHRISLVIPIGEDSYRTENIYLPLKPVDTLRVSPSGILTLFVEHHDKLNRIRIIDQSGLKEYIAYSTKSEINDIVWINDNEIIVLEDSQKIMLVNAVNLKWKMIYRSTARQKIMSLFKSNRKSEFYLSTDKTIAITSLKNLPKSSIAKTVFNNRRGHSFTFSDDSNIIDAQISTGIQEKNLIIDSDTEDYDYIYRVELQYDSNALYASYDTGFSADFYLKIKITKNAEGLKLIGRDLYYYLFSSGRQMLIKHSFDTDERQLFASFPFKAAELQIEMPAFYYILRTGKVSVLTKFEIKNYYDNSSVNSGKYPVSPEKLSFNDFVMTDLSDNIADISSTGEYFLINPVPGHQKNLFINKKYRTLFNSGRQIGYNSSTNSQNFKLEEKNQGEIIDASQSIAKKEFDNAENLILKYIGNLNPADTELKNAAYRKLAQCYQSAGLHKKLAELSDCLKIEFAPLSTMLSVVDALENINELEKAEKTLDSIFTTDENLNLTLEYRKLQLQKKIGGKLFLSSLKKKILLFDNCLCAYSLIYRDFIESLDLFE